MDTIYPVYTWSIYMVHPWIYHVYPLWWLYMVYPWIYHIYSMYMDEDPIYMEYTRHLIPGIHWKIGSQMSLFQPEMEYGSKSLAAAAWVNQPEWSVNFRVWVQCSLASHCWCHCWKVCQARRRRHSESGLQTYNNLKTVTMTGRNWFPKSILCAICLGAKHNANSIAWNRI